ncbi:leucine-rich repeat protein, partial [Candidatus Saccharibacteria bacterium]|nr:leucine-rich repeat protein [Candidatus Saccharibacteria bacterium]
MSKIKTRNNWVFVAFCAFGLSAITSVLINNSAFAAGSGIIENGDARWEYVLEDATADKPQELTIKFYDKTPSATTVTVPSLDWLKANISGIDSTIDTYFLKNAIPSQQDASYPSETRRTPTANTTKLDMTNTSKIQILGVKPIIDPAVETELVFGPNMVIGDGIGKTVNYLGYCRTPATYDSANDRYQCRTEINNYLTVENVEELIPGWDEKTEEEKENYNATIQDLVTATGCTLLPTSSNKYIPASQYDPTKCYLSEEDLNRYPRYITTVNVNSSLAFANYKLKLTNFSTSNFNYIGWKAFKNSTFNQANTNITIDSTIFGGGQIFSGTNVKNITINTTTYGAGLFMDCQNINSITFGEGVDFIVERTFSGTNLTSFDFTNSGIKHIGSRAFEGADLTSVNFTGVERIDYQAFKDNDVRELDLPKSLTRLEAELFRGNGNLKKATVRYDTLSSGMILPFWVVLSNAYSNGTDDNSIGRNPNYSLEEITVVAPYAADEEVGSTHVSYDDYRWHFDSYFNYTDYQNDRSGGNKYASVSINYWNNAGENEWVGEFHRGEEYKYEDTYANVDSYKNVLAPLYFSRFHNLKKVTIGEGYEFIGSSAFWYTNHLRAAEASQGYINGSWPYIQKENGLCDEKEQVRINGTWQTIYYNNVRCNKGTGRYLEKIQLPETLKGVGNLAFEGSYATNVDVNLPNSLEFIGIAAFSALYHMSGDFDLPNLKYLGDHAFNGTSLQNVAIHDTVYYWGVNVFTNIPTLKDITIDVDLYSPDKKIVWADTVHFRGDGNPSMNETFRRQFGWYTARDSSTGATAEERARWNFREATYSIENSSITAPLFGKITFTDKVVHEIPMQLHGCSLSPYYQVNCNQGGSSVDSITSTGNWFGNTLAEEIDLSAAQWKILPRRFAERTMVGKLTLPHNLEVISHNAFTEIVLTDELVIPDTVKIIGNRAFESYNSFKKGLGTPIIKNLPSSLEYIGAHAFWGDENLTADLYSPNLQYLGPEAFGMTNIRDVYIPEGVKWLGEGTFASASLRDITIDADFAKIVNATYVDDYEYPENVLEWAGDATEAGYEIATRSAKYDCYTSTYYEPYDNSSCAEWKIDPFETFTSIFGKNYTFDKSSWPEWSYNGDQLDAGDTFGTVTFTDKNVTDIDGSTGVFSGLTFDTMDMGETSWTKVTNDAYAFNQANIGTLILPSSLKTVTEGAFFDAEIENEFALPTSTETIDRAAFQGATGTITNALPEGVKTINEAAFYETSMTDELVIPASVTYIGESAFNAGSEDVAYDKVTIKPALTYENTKDQLIHQIFWGTTIDKLIIDSAVLPATEDMDLPMNQEFWNMDITSVEINNLPGISYGAFDSCTNLKTVDMSKNSAIRTIGEEAFIGDEKLDTIKFSPAVKNETIVVKPNAFQGTAFTELGDSNSGFDLTAAKFDATPGHSFANMPKLKKVTVPRNFSGATIPEYTFYNDALLEEAIVDYKITDIKNAAFAKDDNLKRIFIWGDTIVQDQSLDGYTAPTRGPSPTVVGPTIPAGTDIYAYSTAKTEAYAASEQREYFEGKFYPLDEV